MGRRPSDEDVNDDPEDDEAPAMPAMAGVPSRGPQSSTASGEAIVVAELEGRHDTGELKVEDGDGSIRDGRMSGFRLHPGP